MTNPTSSTRLERSCARLISIHTHRGMPYATALDRVSEILHTRRSTRFDPEANETYYTVRALR